jgi:hypothetical protein
MTGRARALAPLLLDLVLPVGGYLLLHNAFGLSTIWASAVAAAVTGIVVLTTCFTGRPLVYDAGKPFATHGDPGLLTAYEWTWMTSTRFRRVIRGVTAGWGVAFLMDAVMRIVEACSLPARQLDRSLLLWQLPSVALLAGAVLLSRLRLRTLRTLMEVNRPVAI